MNTAISTGGGTHGRKICEFGVLHSQCRCPNDKIVRIQCPTPLTCGTEGDHYLPKHRKDE